VVQRETDTHTHTASINSTKQRVSKTQYTPYGGGQISNFGILWGTSPNRGEDTSGTHTIMQNFTPIGDTVAEISVSKKQTESKLIKVPYHTNAGAPKPLTLLRRWACLVYKPKRDTSDETKTVGLGTRPRTRPRQSNH